MREKGPQCMDEFIMSRPWRNRAIQLSAVLNLDRALFGCGLMFGARVQTLAPIPNLSFNSARLKFHPSRELRTNCLECGLISGGMTSHAIGHRLSEVLSSLFGAMGGASGHGSGSKDRFESWGQNSHYLTEKGIVGTGSFISNWL